MTYTIEIGRHAESYGNIVQKPAFESFPNPGKSFPHIFDIEYELFTDNGATAHVPAQILERLPVGAHDWLRASGTEYRIEAVYEFKEAPASPAKSLLGGDCITYGYVLNVVVEDEDTAMLFKLTFGGAA